MTEAQWLACEEPAKMLAQVRDRASDRKLRLLACACVRRVWAQLRDPASRAAVEAAERYADGLIDAAELEQAQRATYATLRGSGRTQAALAASKVARPDRYLDAVRMAALAESVRTGNSARQRRGHRALLREIFGPLPFRPVPVRPDWLTWNDGVVTKLAGAIHAERAWERLPVLADALEEAGCDDPDLLGHLRGRGSHVPGCWVIDLLRGEL